MTKNERAKDWLRRAKSNLARARAGRVSEEVLYEDLCFDAQQAAEKALKALCVQERIRFTKLHDIAYLIELLEQRNVKVPQKLLKAKALTDYAVETRYPGDYPAVDEAMYRSALMTAEKVVIWVEKRLAFTNL